MFGAQTVLKGADWRRNLDSRFLPDDILFALLPDAMILFSATRTDEIEIAWSRRFTNWIQHFEIRKGEGIFLLASILDVFSAAARVMISA